MQKNDLQQLKSVSWTRVFFSRMAPCISLKIENFIFLCRAAIASGIKIQGPMSFYHHETAFWAGLTDGSDTQEITVMAVFQSISLNTHLVPTNQFSDVCHIMNR